MTKIKFSFKLIISIDKGIFGNKKVKNTLYLYIYIYIYERKLDLLIQPKNLYYPKTNILSLN